MQVYAVSYPSESVGATSIRFLVPAYNEAFRQPSDSFMKVGNPSSIGNRSCTHLKAEWSIIPLAPKYNVQDYYKKDKYYQLYSSTGLRYSTWTSLLNLVFLRTVDARNYSTYTIERKMAVTHIDNGLFVFYSEYHIRYKNTTQNDQSEYSTQTFRLRKGSSIFDVLIDVCRVGKINDQYSIKKTITGYLQSIDYLPSTISAKNLWRMYGGELSWRAHTLLPLREFGELANDCVTTGDRAYQTSSAQYLLELGQLATLLSPYTELIKGGLSARKAANAWLSYYYGARLTAKDTYAQISGIIRRSQRRIMDYDVLRAIDRNSVVITDGTTISGYRSLNCYYSVHSNWLVNSYRALRRYGLNPSLSLAWDLVPLSFVVDWLVPIGDYLQHFDSQTFSDSLRIIESLLTTKYTVTTNATSFGHLGNGQITMTWYNRSISPGTIPKPTFKFETRKLTGMNFLNGVSLVVQRQG